MSPDGMDMTCKELVELVTAYLEDALADEDREAFEAHLEICEDCVVYVRQLQDTIRLVGASADELEQTPAVGALLELFNDWRSETPEPA